MKARVKSTEFKRVISAVLALQKLNEAKTKSKKDDTTIATGIKGRITVTEGKLTIESANMGAYACVTAEATMLRPGTVGIDLLSVEKIRLSGTAEISADGNGRLTIKGGRSKYELPIDQDAAELIEALVPDRSGATLVAKVPTEILAKAAAMVAIKPGLKAETMRMQFSFERTEQGNQMEVTGLDFYSYGRFVRVSPDIQLRKNTRFVLRAASLSTILKYISGEGIMIGVQQAADEEESASVRFKTEGADIVYPTLDMPFQSPSEVYAHITSGTMDGGFTALRKNVREALNTMKTVASGNKPLILNVRITPGEIQMRAVNEGKDAFATIAATDIQLASREPHVMRLNQAYFSGIVSLAPEVIPMRVESWNSAQVVVRGENIENGRIEYSMSQVDSANLPAEEEN